MVRHEYLRGDSPSEGALHGKLAAPGACYPSSLMLLVVAADAAAADRRLGRWEVDRCVSLDASGPARQLV